MYLAKDVRIIAKNAFDKYAGSTGVGPTAFRSSEECDNRQHCRHGAECAPLTMRVQTQMLREMRLHLAYIPHSTYNGSDAQ
jgi:hypothetical protein